MGHALASGGITDSVDLVLHQGDERRYHDGDALANHGRQLVAQTFAATRGHDDKGIVAIKQTLDDGLLVAFELVKTEDFFQIFVQILHHSQYFAQ